jgi:hypothetical protein
VEPSVPRGLSDLIVRLLAKEPSARPQSAGAVTDELAGLAVRPAGPDPSTTPPEERPPVRRHYRAAIVLAAGVLAAVLGGSRLACQPEPGRDPPADPGASNPVRYRGQVDVLVEREVEPGRPPKLVRLDDPRALPLHRDDKFRIEGKVDPPAYLYLVWVDPGKDVTPVYPWDPKAGWGSRPAREEPVGRVSLPPDTGNRYTAPKAKPGVATMVLFARPTPLDVPDDEVRRWFEGLPDLALPRGGEHAAVWFDDYVEVRDLDRLRTFGEVGSDDPFARWQGRLQQVLGGKASFQTAVSFARVGGK